MKHRSPDWQEKFEKRGNLRVAEVKATVRKRDGFKCTKCEITNTEHKQQFKKALEVHRLVPGSLYTVEGCVTLCVKCHDKEPIRKNGEPDLEACNRAETRSVRLHPELAELLDQLSEEEFTSLTSQVVTAVREYLQRRERLPKPDGKR